ncbi:hypothetical protein SBRCBS47491_002511 [Sporothrix bragantina]|uniref:Uncharacterized protein n=1 Tax=Sporothrix bragantina TaxID=671064 RepID=A0ABP0B8I7_9PEZI
MSYIQLSQQYTQKTVDCDGDALRSFYGISRPLFAGMRTIGVEGLPGYYINAFLLFKLPTGDARRWPEFGSFSWAGWQGGIEWLFHELGGSARDVVHWLKYDSLVEWDELTPSGQLQDLVQMEEDGSKQSNLVLFLQEHQHIFPGGAELLSKASQHDQFKSYITGTTGRLDMVSWGRDILDVPEGAFPEIERFPLWAFDLVSSRIELDRLLRQNGLQGYDLAMRGWSTSRRYSAFQGALLSVLFNILLTKQGLKILAEAQKGTDSPFKRAIPAPNTPRYRQPRLAKDSDEEKARLASDKRAANARKHDPEADIP